MLSLHNLTFTLGVRPLYTQASLHLAKGDKIGLVGGNGSGKSTLFRIIMGSISPQSGEISHPKNYTIGWLHQELIDYQAEGTAVQVVMEGNKHLMEVQKKLSHALAQLGENPTESALNQISDLQQTFSMHGGYELEGAAEKILLGLGFGEKERTLPFNALSGGWRMRTLLGKLLLEKPDLLLLDEPTNHLDIEVIRWVESYLRNYSKEFILISHDKSLLDGVTNKIVAIEKGALQTYPGNYTAYETNHIKQKELIEKTIKKEQEEMDRMQAFVNRFRSKASKARQAQSVLKALEKKKEAATQLKQPTRKHKARFHFPVEHPSEKVPIAFQDLAQQYGENIVFIEATGQVNRGDKIGLIGANGKGKSTLLRLLKGAEKPAYGEVKQSKNVNIAFYTQHQLESLNGAHTPLQELRASATAYNEQEAWDLLGAFRISTQMAHQPIHLLSGGEKACVALAKIALQKPNCMLLDEPTNHLDMEALQVLSEALQNYQGSYILISHNRSFLLPTTNLIWLIHEGVLRTFPGSYKEYEEWRQAQEETTTRQ